MSSPHRQVIEMGLTEGMDTDGGHQAGAFVSFIPGWDCWLKSSEPNHLRNDRKDLEGSLDWLFPPQYIYSIYMWQSQDVAQP